MLEIAVNKVAQVIFLAREGPAGGSELAGFIEDMNEDDQAQLVALAWVGRGAFEPEEFSEALTTAYTEKTTPTSDYLRGMPHLAENLEAGLEALGFDVSEIENDLL